MGMREKLIELIKNATFTCPDGITNCHNCEYYEKDAFGNPCNEIKLLSDYLIANGVTIPVRCEDCKHWLHDFPGCTDAIGRCEWANYMVGGNGYCVYGERRTE